ncbi:MAG: hypothetical protein V7655_01690 [Aequorivita antarctica]
MKNTFLIIFSLLFMLSCDTNDDCAATDPREPAINIRIVDTAGNSLIGENNIYKPSEITLSRGSQEVFLIFNEYNEETYIKLYYPEMESEKDYQLKLNDQEIDILNLRLKNLEGECFDFLSMESFSINGEEIQLDNNSYSYIIRK